jgi:hypothetical protein
MKTTNSTDMNLETYKRRKAPTFAAIEKTALKGAANVALDPDLNPQSFLDVVDADTESEKVEARQHFHPRVNEIEGRLDQLQMESRKRTLKGKHERNGRQMRATDIDLSQVTITYNWRTFWPRVVGIFLLVLVDALLNYKSLELIVSSAIVALFVALVIAGGLGFAAHIIGRQMQQAPTIQLKRKRFWLGLGAGSVFFLVLGLLRAAFYSGGSSLLSNPILWMIASAFFFATAILLAVTLPTKEQEAQRAHELELKKKRAELSVEQTAIEKELANINEAFAELVKSKAMLEESHADIEAYIEAQRQLITARALHEYHIRGGNYQSTRPYTRPLTSKSLP